MAPKKVDKQITFEVAKQITLERPKGGQTNNSPAYTVYIYICSCKVWFGKLFSPVFTIFCWPKWQMSCPMLLFALFCRLEFRICKGGFSRRTAQFLFFPRFLGWNASSLFLWEAIIFPIVKGFPFFLGFSRLITFQYHLLPKALCNSLFRWKPKP